MNKEDNSYKTISEVVKILNLKSKKGDSLPTHTLRFWEKEFEFLTPKKNNKGTRKFTAQDIDKIELIHFLVKERGFTLEGAKKEIQSKNSSQHQIIKRLKSIREELLRIRENL